MYGKGHIQSAISYSSMAQMSYAANDYKQAFVNQEKSHNIVKKLMPEDSEVVKESYNKLDIFLKLSVNYERNKAVMTR